MKFEQPPMPSQEKEDNNEQENRIQITMEELNKYSESSVDNEELKNWMEEKGIEFNQGSIKVSIDGENHLFSTDKNDFGTISYPEDKTGYDLMKEEKIEK